MREAAKHQKSLHQRVLSVVGIVLCVIFGFFLICNLTIIIKGSLFPEKPPSVLSITPMVVMSASMSGDDPQHIEIGDLIFVGKANPAELKTGDVISFMQGETVVTHRIVETQIVGDGSVQWVTQGIANNAPDVQPVTESNLVGIYLFRIAKVGGFALFLQKPLSMVLFIGIPLLAFVIYEIIRRRRYAANERERAAAYEAELERLRMLADEKDTEVKKPEILEVK